MTKMQSSPSSAARRGIGTAVRTALVIWTIYSSIHHFRQAKPSAATILQPLWLWLYRLKKHDKTALTDVLLFVGAYVLISGIPNPQDFVQLVPSWILEERFMEVKIFGMIFVLAILAGIIVYRGDNPRESSEGSVDYWMVLVYLMSFASCLWMNDIRSLQDLLRVLPPWISNGSGVNLKSLAMLAVPSSLVGAFLWRRKRKPHIKFADGATSSSTQYPIPPLLIPGRTTHTRLFPEKHSFEYSYLSVGVPIGWQGHVGSVLSCDVEHLPCGKRQRGWFDVSAKDYLSRNDNACLEHKLAHYLQSQGVPDEDWSFAYLVTAPKFLGYSFNPVSFWYIYDGNSRLTMMILEVNNTFDERRIYLLKAAEGENAEREYFPPTGVKFSNEWKKDFHVSPFNDREGTYTLTANDPLAAFTNQSNNDKPVFDNLIVLKTPESQAKLIARVFSTGVKDANKITTTELAVFLANWFWVGFVTFPRIIREAFNLYYKKNLDIWFRPEVLPTSIARQQTPEEAAIEPFFRAYLQNLVAHSSRPIRVAYEPPPGMGHHHMFVSPGKTVVDEADEPDAVLRVLSPLFYSRLVHYAHLREALDREGTATDEKNRTIVLENPSLLHELFDSAHAAVLDTQKSRLGLMESMRWKLLTRLRCPPPPVSYPAASHSPAPGVSIQDIRAQPPSALDLFVEQHSEDREAYRLAVTRLFLAARYTGGFTALLSLADVVVRTGLIAVSLVAAGGVVAFSAVNLWSLAKGL